jgi:hypothetical protein
VHQLGHQLTAPVKNPRVPLLKRHQSQIRAPRPHQALARGRISRCPAGLPSHGRQYLRGRGPPAGRRYEHGAHRLGQAQRAGQQLGGVLAGGAVDTPLQVTDRPWAQGRRVRQLLLGQPGFSAQLPQQPGEFQRRRLGHGRHSPPGALIPPRGSPAQHRQDLHQGKSGPPPSPAPRYPGQPGIGARLIWPAGSTISRRPGDHHT